MLRLEEDLRPYRRRVNECARWSRVQTASDTDSHYINMLELMVTNTQLNSYAFDPRAHTHSREGFIALCYICVYMIIILLIIYLYNIHHNMLGGFFKQNQKLSFHLLRFLNINCDWCKKLF